MLNTIKPTLNRDPLHQTVLLVTAVDRRSPVSRKQAESRVGRTLETQREELQQTSEDRERPRCWNGRKLKSRPNREVEEARWEMERRPNSWRHRVQVEFLANMSHELAPAQQHVDPLRQLAENGDTNLTSKQVQFAETIHSSGGDLLTLINDILDLSRSNPA